MLIKENLSENRLLRNKFINIICKLPSPVATQVRNSFNHNGKDNVKLSTYIGIKKEKTEM